MNPIAQVASFYAPFVGLLGVVFWLGVLSNRVQTLEREVREMKAAERAMVPDGNKLVRLETLMEEAGKTIERLRVSVESLQRQMGTLMSRGQSPVQSFDTAREG